MKEKLNMVRCWIRFWELARTLILKEISNSFHCKVHFNEHWFGCLEIKIKNVLNKFISRNTN